MESLKRQLLLEYLKTHLGHVSDQHPDLIERAVAIARIEYAIKYQILEPDGPAAEGRAWLSANSMAHSYYYNETSKNNVGTYIWKKNEPILFSRSLLHDQPRNQIIQVLEPGIVLSIAYADLLEIRQAFPAIAQHIEDVSSLREQNYQERIVQLSAPPIERITRFEADNPEFCLVANVKTKAMHVGLCRQTYSSILKKIKDQNGDNLQDLPLP